jgi:hypothetical protein
MKDLIGRVAAPFEFPVTITTEYKTLRGMQIPNCKITDGGNIMLRTVRGRDEHRLAFAIHGLTNGNPDRAYDLLPIVVASGIDPKIFEDLHWSVISAILEEVYKRSHLSEEERGN